MCPENIARYVVGTGSSQRGAAELKDRVQPRSQQKTHFPRFSCVGNGESNPLCPAGKSFPCWLNNIHRGAAVGCPLALENCYLLLRAELLDQFEAYKQNVNMALDSNYKIFAAREY